jgi:hypothetical protein
MDSAEKQRREEQARIRLDQKRRRDRSIIMHVLLTDIPTKIIAAKHGLKCAGNVRDITRSFSYRMMLRGYPQWEEWRLNRANRTDTERKQLIELLITRFGAQASDFEGW